MLLTSNRGIVCQLPRSRPARLGTANRRQAKSQRPTEKKNAGNPITMNATAAADDEEAPWWSSVFVM